MRVIDRSNRRGLWHRSVSWVNGVHTGVGLEVERSDKKVAGKDKIHERVSVDVLLIRID